MITDVWNHCSEKDNKDADKLLPRDLVTVVTGPGAPLTWGEACDRQIVPSFPSLHRKRPRAAWQVGSGSTRPLLLPDFLLRGHEPGGNVGRSRSIMAVNGEGRLCNDRFPNLHGPALPGPPRTFLSAFSILHLVLAVFGRQRKAVLSPSSVF